MGGDLFLLGGDLQQTVAKEGLIVTPSFRTTVSPAVPEGSIGRGGQKISTAPASINIGAKAAVENLAEKIGLGFYAATTKGIGVSRAFSDVLVQGVKKDDIDFFEMDASVRASKNLDVAARKDQYSRIGFDLASTNEDAYPAWHQRSVAQTALNRLLAGLPQQENVKVEPFALNMAEKAREAGAVWSKSGVLRSGVQNTVTRDPNNMLAVESYMPSGAKIAIRKPSIDQRTPGIAPLVRGFAATGREILTGQIPGTITDEGAPGFAYLRALRGEQKTPEAGEIRTYAAFPNTLPGASYRNYNPNLSQEMDVNDVVGYGRQVLKKTDLPEFITPQAILEGKIKWGLKYLTGETSGFGQPTTSLGTIGLGDDEQEILRANTQMPFTPGVVSGASKFLMVPDTVNAKGEWGKKGESSKGMIKLLREQTGLKVIPYSGNKLQLAEVGMSEEAIRERGGGTKANFRKHTGQPRCPWVVETHI
jgi:hypothetical protein